MTKFPCPKTINPGICLFTTKWYYGTSCWTSRWFSPGNGGPKAGYIRVDTQLLRATLPPPELCGLSTQTILRTYPPNSATWLW